MNPFAFLRSQTDEHLEVRDCSKRTPLTVSDLEERFVPTTGLFSSWGQSFDWGKVADWVSHDKGGDHGHSSGQHHQGNDGKADLFSKWNNVKDWLKKKFNDDCKSPTGSDKLVADGIYKLSNHPEFGIGLRLDNLITDANHPATTYNFDFNHPDSNIRMEVKGDTIRIYGTVFGGREADWQTKEFDPSTTGLWQIEFTYENVTDAVDDDDKEVLAGGPLGSGQLIQLYGDQIHVELEGDAGMKTFAFRLGNQDDDQGYVGHDGVSGWGWLLHSGNNFEKATSDWNFTAKLIKKGDDCDPWKRDGHKDRHWSHRDNDDRDDKRRGDDDGCVNYFFKKGHSGRRW